MIDTESFDPCAACGSGHIELTGNPFISGKRWVACCQCKHTGPLGDTEWEAIAGWNQMRAIRPDQCGQSRPCDICGGESSRECPWENFTIDSR